MSVVNEHSDHQITQKKLTMIVTVKKRVIDELEGEKQYTSNLNDPLLTNLIRVNALLYLILTLKGKNLILLSDKILFQKHTMKCL